MTTKATSRLILWLLLASAAVLHAADKEEYSPDKESSPISRLDWLNGPGTGKLGDRATLRFPAEFRFLEKSGAKKFLEMTGNEPDGDETGVIIHKQDDWWVVFEFDEIGYVKDDEKNDLKADELLQSYKDGTAAQNERRKDDGIPPIEIVGWHVSPTYNDQTKNLEWSIEAESRGRRFVNYNVRLLGRKGVTKITLLETREKVDATLPKFREMLKGHQYTSGESYAEYRQGDKIAKYGLGALVLARRGGGGGEVRPARPGHSRREKRMEVCDRRSRRGRGVAEESLHRPEEERPAARLSGPC